MTHRETPAFTPPEVAARYGVKPSKILGWIRSGELAAMNLATSLSGRPRFRITAEALAEFEARRTVAPVVKPKARPRRHTAGRIEFFK